MKRNPGRPRLDDDDESIDVHLTLTGRQYDDLYRRASETRITVQEEIRRHLPPPDRQPPIRNPK